MNTVVDEVSQHAGLIEEAMTALRERLHVGARLVDDKSDSTSKMRLDGRLEITFDGKPTRYAVECQPTMDRRLLAQHVKQRLDAASRPGVLITPYVSREIASYCRDIGLQFIDTHGNAYLKGRGFLVYVAGERHDDGMRPGRSSGSTAGAAGLRVALALLSKSDMVAAPYREIASKAGVSLGAVSNAMEDLERRGIVIAGSSGHRRQLLEPGRLLDEWTLNYPIQLRPKLNGRRFSVPDESWWKDERLDGNDTVWGGEVAAEQFTRYLKPVTQTVYVAPAARSAWLKTLVTTHRARPDSNGTLEVLDKFWGAGLEQRHGAAPFALVYADLLASLDPRAAETAQIMRKEWMDGAFNPA